MPVARHSIPDVDGFVTSLVRNVPGAVYRCDVDADFTMQLVGDEIERMSGYPTSDFVGNAVRSFDSIIHPEDRDRVHREVHAALDADEPFVLEYRIVNAAGEERWILDRGLRAVDAFGRECLDGIIFDVTHRRLAEEARLRSEAAAARAAELEASRARIVAAADDARRRIERDLHDGAQQRLVAASLALRVAERRLVESPESAAMMLVRARTELEAGLEELRELARGIHPAVLTDHGLVDALRALAERAAVPVRIECGVSERFEARIETALYYCATEALTNVVKHAGATHVRLRLRREDGLVALEVADNGCGGAQSGRGSGLSGLEDRLAVAGGTLEVVSAPGEGTLLRATIPVG
jgi:PAS domain S-box-containing protein